MVKIVCPNCGAKSRFEKEEVVLYSRVECEGCGVLLEIIDEDPLEVEVVDEYDPSDDDDDDDDEDDDDR